MTSLDNLTLMTFLRRFWVGWAAWALFGGRLGIWSLRCVVYCATFRCVVLFCTAKVRVMVNVRVRVRANGSLVSVHVLCCDCLVVFLWVSCACLVLYLWLCYVALSRLVLSIVCFCLVLSCDCPVVVLSCGGLVLCLSCLVFFFFIVFCLFDSLLWWMSCLLMILRLSCSEKRKITRD
jgi:hypothetical protein